MHIPFDMILIASSFFKALSVKRALKRLCNKTSPDIFSSVASSRSRSVDVTCGGGNIMRLGGEGSLR